MHNCSLSTLSHRMFLGDCKCIQAVRESFVAVLCKSMLLCISDNLVIIWRVEKNDALCEHDIVEVSLPIVKSLIDRLSARQLE